MSTARCHHIIYSQVLGRCESIGNATALLHSPCLSWAGSLGGVCRCSHSLGKLFRLHPSALGENSALVRFCSFMLVWFKGDGSHLYFCNPALSARTKCHCSSFSKSQLSLSCFQSIRAENTILQKSGLLSCSITGLLHMKAQDQAFA